MIKTKTMKRIPVFMRNYACIPQVPQRITSGVNYVKLCLTQ